MRVFEFLDDLNIIKLNIKVLVHGFQGAFNGDVVFELYGNFVINQSFEKAVAI